MSAAAEPPKDLLAGRRALESVVGCQILRDLRWFDTAGVWALHLRLTPPGLLSTELVPSSTDWFLTVEEDYPSGRIGLYPAKEGGLTKTFWHQRLNVEGGRDEPWRLGNICTELIGRSLRRFGFDREPATQRERIRWHVCRAMAWLEAAARGELVQAGDPFELPDGSVSRRPVIGFAEDPEALQLWLESPSRAGLVELVPHPRNGEILVARRFTNWDGKLIREVPWGTEISRSSRGETALWVFLDEVPVLPPWQAPTTWCELQAAAKMVGVNLATLLRHLPGKFRDAGSHTLLVGFPVPRRFGEAPERVHWWAVRLPVLSYGQQTVHGLRPEKGGWRNRDLRRVFPRSPLKWLRTENWAEDEISTRGRFSPDLRKRSILLIGAGALGSAVAELLVRGGVHDVTVMDGDLLQTGNLVRHALTMEDVGSAKASALAAWLNSLSPHARIKSVDECFPPKDHQSVAGVDMILDCTAEDTLLTKLSAFSWSGEKDFVSLSLGMHARRLFAFTARSATFPRQVMLDELQPWLSDEPGHDSLDDLPWEGIGCWHPIFPARADDVRLFASLTVRRLEQWIENPGEPKLAVFERDDEGTLVGRVSNG